MYKNILVPVVFDEEHDTTVSYRAARALADENANYTVMHVMETIPTYVTAEISEDLLQRTHQEADKLLVQSAKALPGAVAMLISGNAGSAIVEYANKHSVDCIVLASHRPGFGDYFLGSTASKVVRHAKCSVHVIR